MIVTGFFEGSPYMLLEGYVEGKTLPFQLWKTLVFTHFETKAGFVLVLVLVWFGWGMSCIYNVACAFVSSAVENVC